MPVDGEMWFAVLPDADSAQAAAHALCRRAPQVIEHASGRPWLVGRWPADQMHLAGAGAAQVAVIGRCLVTAADLDGRARALNGGAPVDALAAGLPGSFHLAVSAGGQVTVRGVISGMRRVFHTRLAGVEVAASRADVLAELVEAPVDEEVLAARLLPAGLITHVQETSMWRGVRALPPELLLLLHADGSWATRCWWRPPEPVLPLKEGAAALREALISAADSCTAAGGTISADLSGGLDSTSLCFLAARGCAELVTVHYRTLDRFNDDDAWASRAAAELPAARHMTIDAEQMPAWFAGLTTVPPPLEEPGAWVRDTERLATVARRVKATGSRLHLTGGGGDELFSPTPGYLHDLVRSRPLMALRRLRAHRPMWRQSWSTLLRALADNTPYNRWLGRCAEHLATGTLDLRDPATGWSIPPFMPTWATPEAVAAARRVLEGIARQAPEPLAPQRAAHQILTMIRSSGMGHRLLQQGIAQHGVSFAAPYHDDAVIEAVLSVRPHEWSQTGTYKPLLTTAMTGIAPTPILQRVTKGEYSAEFHTGLHRHRRDLLDLIEGSHLARMGLVNPAAFRAALLAPQRDASDVGLPLLQTLACEMWLRAAAHHQSGPRPPARAAAQTRHRP
ncbi:asparagine synthase-related protein [Nonomuraea purpurea]|uniref:asparagine synthase (glutamine-hydrolyzing) n=1 Tax=Nonomuraea purpurea TaxID=1849276 RepID=A0ABV8GQK1_9ACTN